MYEIDFISAECYPAAKVGGLADVVGALPKYINKVAEHKCNVFMPYYGIPWFDKQSFTEVARSILTFDKQSERLLPPSKKSYTWSIKKLQDASLGFDLYAIDIPGLFDRNGVYAEDGVFFEDEPQRNIAFQRIYLDYLLLSRRKPQIIHCHDHHSGLIPYFLTKSPLYKELATIPTVFTIHNGEYHGAFDWSNEIYLPPSQSADKGLLDWDKAINSLSSAIRCAWGITTVSPTYMKEITQSPGSFRQLLLDESPKTKGILNGIDYDVWNPKTDKYLPFNLKSSLQNFKKENKKYLSNLFEFDTKLPLFSFIGRFANEKGIDVLCDTIESFLSTKGKFNILILGTGDKLIEKQFSALNDRKDPRFHAEIAYDEKLAHTIYAGSDFLLMPSRVEPCGLNQMYAMRYGTLPIAHGVGGLEDTVSNDYGYKFHGLTTGNLSNSLDKAINEYKNKTLLKNKRNLAHEADFSWEASCKNYLNLYYEYKKFSK